MSGSESGSVRRVHLVRHGRTAWNDERRVMGWLDHDISPGWAVAAERVADVLAASEAVVRVVSSPLRRARTTAAPLAERLGMEVGIDDRFGEHRVGPWEGLAELDIAERWPEESAVWRDEPHRLVLEGRETLVALNERVADGLEAVVSELPDEGVAVVFTHDAVVRAAVAWALSVGPEVYRHIQVDNCSITTVAVAGDRRQLVLANGTAHLHGLAADGLNDGRGKPHW